MDQTLKNLVNAADACVAIVESLKASVAYKTEENTVLKSRVTGLEVANYLLTEDINDFIEVIEQRDIAEEELHARIEALEKTNAELYQQIEFLKKPARITRQSYKK